MDDFCRCILQYYRLSVKRNFPYIIITVKTVDFRFTQCVQLDKPGYPLYLPGPVRWLHAKTLSDVTIQTFGSKLIHLINAFISGSVAEQHTCLLTGSSIDIGCAMRKLTCHWYPVMNVYFSLGWGCWKITSILDLHVVHIEILLFLTWLFMMTQCIMSTMSDNLHKFWSSI